MVYIPQYYELWFMGFFRFPVNLLQSSSLYNLNKSLDILFCLHQ